MLKSIERLTKIGLHPSFPEETDLRRNIRMINTIYLIEVSVILTYHPVLYFFDQIDTLLFNNLFIINATLGLILNWRRKYHWSFYNFVLGFPLFVLCFCLLFGPEANAEYYYLFVIPILWLLIDSTAQNIIVTVYIVCLFMVSKVFYSTHGSILPVPDWYFYFGYTNLLFMFIAFALVIANFKSSFLASQRRVNDRNEVLQKLIAIISHDIRSPLISIDTMLKTSQMGGMDSIRLNRFLDKIKKSTGSTLNLIDNLLSWTDSQMEGVIVNPQKTSLFLLTLENTTLYRQMAEEKQLLIKNYVQEDHFVFADLEMIKLVIRNLLQNAIKFTPQGGLIKLASHKLPWGVICFQISDSGPGLNGKRPFDLLRTTETISKSNAGDLGSGLGLLLCKDFVVKNNGKIWADSDGDTGSDFYFELPTYKNKLNSKRMKNGQEMSLPTLD